MPVVLAGDTNVVPTERDIYPTKSYDDDALLQPASRKVYQQLLAQGWLDAVRALHPDAPMYSFWDYMRKRWERDAGLRLDQILLSPDLAGRLAAAGVDRAVRGKHERQRPRSGVGGVARVAATPRCCGLERPRGLHEPARPTPKVGAPLQPSPTKRRPLLVIDGDSFAHRAYHALPKTILRKGDRPAGAILGFANFLLRFYQAEQPRAVLVGWDTLEEPTYRHEQFPAYQSGREFDDALIEQLAALPELVAACGFANAKAPGYEADDFLAAAVAREEKRRRHSAGGERRP